MLAFSDLVPTVVAAIEAQSGLPVGNARIPGTAQATPDAPFAIVYQVAGTQNETAQGFPSDMTWITIQVTSVGENATQSSVMADMARTAILGKSGGSYVQALDPDGLTVCGRSIDDLPRTFYDEGLWQTTETFRLLVTE